MLFYLVGFTCFSFFSFLFLLLWFFKKKTSIFMTSCFFIHSKSCCMPAPFLWEAFCSKPGCTVTDQFINDLFVLCLVIGLIELKFTSRHSGKKKNTKRKKKIFGQQEPFKCIAEDSHKPERCTACPWWGGPTPIVQCHNVCVHGWMFYNRWETEGGKRMLWTQCLFSGKQDRWHEVL